MTLVGVPIREVIQDLLPGAVYGWLGDSSLNNELSAVQWRDRDHSKPTENDLIEHYNFMVIRDTGKASENTTEAEYRRLQVDRARTIDLSQIKPSSDFEALVLMRLEDLERRVKVNDGKA